MDNGVQNGVVGNDVEALVPLLLLLVALGGKSLVHETVELLPLSGLLPRATGLHPDVVAVPPVEQQVGVGAEAGRIAGGKEDIVGLAAVDGSVGSRRGIGLDGHIEAESVEVVLDRAAMPLICSLSVVRRVMAPGVMPDSSMSFLAFLASVLYTVEAS